MQTHEQTKIAKRKIAFVYRHEVWGGCYVGIGNHTTASNREGERLVRCTRGRGGEGARATFCGAGNVLYPPAEATTGPNARRNVHLSSPRWSPATTVSLPDSAVLPSLERHVSRVPSCTVLRVGLFGVTWGLCSLTASRTHFSHCSAVFRWTAAARWVHLSTSGWTLGLFTVWDYTWRMNLHIRVFAQTCVFISLG